MSRIASKPGALIGLLCGATLTGCGLTGAGTPKHELPPAPGSAPLVRRIAQLDFGREARYALCAAPTCPVVTQKTLAALPESSASRIVVQPNQELVNQGVERPVAKPVAQPVAPGVNAASSIDIPSSASLPHSAPHTLVLRFKTNSAALTVEHKATLRGALADLQRTDQILIAGRTDDLGSEDVNQSLALSRALAIRDHLLDLSPDLPARISIDAKGRCCYAVPNNSDLARAQNRRVELVYTPRAGAVR